MVMQTDVEPRDNTRDTAPRVGRLEHVAAPDGGRASGLRRMVLRSDIEGGQNAAIVRDPYVKRSWPMSRLENVCLLFLGQQPVNNATHAAG
jgi:hypothetical protein